MDNEGIPEARASIHQRAAFLQNELASQRKRLDIELKKRGASDRLADKPKSVLAQRLEPPPRPQEWTARDRGSARPQATIPSLDGCVEIALAQARLLGFAIDG